MTEKKVLTKKWMKILFINLALLFLTISTLQAQQPAATPAPAERERVAAPGLPTPQPSQTPPPATDDEVIRVDSRLVVVPASVLDANGQPVMNLTAQDFRLAEEGRAQEIAEISSAEQVPLEIALIIDTSSSVNPLFEYEKQAAARFLREVMKPEDRASIFLAGERSTMLQPRESAERVAATLQDVQQPTTQTPTAFFDTVSAAIDYLKRNAPQRSRRVILTLSDGADNWSNLMREAEKVAVRGIDIDRVTRAQLDKRTERTERVFQKAADKVLRELQSADLTFYSINPAGMSIKLNKEAARGQNGLQKFADETGGTPFLVNVLPAVKGSPLQSNENKSRNEEILTQIFRQIAAELRAQYLLQYYSETNFPSGRYVKLETALNNKPNLRVKARRGYFAGNQ